ncbi:LysR family transcriptional regulator [Sanguibacter antarcticus]|uniref:DNA-binding transcriptional LysR family regulator n=1 Tax=Sanguibacter antarcticus TaxID=372484 RepID=A0A2A9E7C7_9MICO|nr:LysR family transcriptional regulator [Sanguibacter antarcticus]PFG34764.1 DNA-binding transcriptional LysR family regulator [Sanguibacter antarcticus]
MAIDARRLGVLLAVHRAGGVVAAADLLRLTPSAVSQQIAKLELEENVQVLDRGPRGVTLTAVGLMLAEAAERIETELVEARKQIALLGPEVSGRVVIGAFQTVTRSVVAPMLTDLALTAPGIEISVHEVESVDAARGLRSGELDLVVLEHDSASARPVPKGFSETLLLDEPWRLVVPTSMAVPATVQGLKDAVWIGAEKDTAAARALARVVALTGAVQESRHAYSSYEVALALVAAGQGIALLPALALQTADLQGVDVVQVAGLGTRRIAARHRANRHEPTSAVTAVVDGLLAHVAVLDLG